MRINGFASPIGLCRILLLGLLFTTVGCCGTSAWVANKSGMRQYCRGHYAQARNRFARAVAHDPCNPDYRHNLAMAIQKQGDAGGCERILRHNLSVSAMHQPTYHSLAQLMISQGRAPEAQDLLAGWVATQPYVPESNVEMAWLQREQGDVPGAEQSLQNALRADPSHPVALAHLGQLYQTSGRPDQAVAYYQRSLASNWDQPEVQSRLATLLDNGPATRSALMQNSNGGQMMAGGPMMMNGGPMMVSAPMVTADPMMASNQMMVGDPMMATAPMMTPSPEIAAAAPFGSDPQTVLLEDVRANPEPRRQHRKHGKDRDNNPVLSAYPLPTYGSPATAWVPAGTVTGQPTMSYQPDPTMMTQLAPPQLSESIASPYVSNRNGPTLLPQADPAHSSESTTEMTASVPTVDAH